MRRRSFLKKVGGVVGTGSLGVGALAAGQQPASTAEQEAKTDMPLRVLGRTGKKVSIIGFPGLALVRYEQEECTAGLHKAFEKGVRYFDVAPAYGRGDAEIKMGIGLEGIDRQSYFLSCKTKMRDKAGCREELERSLDRLKTDHFDLYQLHCLIQPDEVKQALGPGGAMETILEAKEEGKVKAVGFSAHTTKAAVAALEGFPFDTVMFPISFVEYFLIGFGKPVLKLAAEKGAAVLAIKTMCRGDWPPDMSKSDMSRRCWYRPVEDEREINMAVRFTLSQTPVVAAIPPSFLDLADQAFDTGRAYRPITEEETAKLRKIAKTCYSEFHDVEMSVASALPGGHRRAPRHRDNPHEGCAGDLA